MDNLDNLLAGGQAFQHIPTDSLFRYNGNELLYNLEINVSLKKGHTNFTHGLLDVLLGKLTVTPELFKDIV